MSQLFVLFEHASGYALFKVAEFEETASFIQQVQKSVSDVNSFQSIVELVSYHRFITGRDTLDNMNSVSEGVLHPHLQQFLENNLPKSKKKHPVTLGVGEAKLAAGISEALGVNCSVSGIVPEVIRGIRFHFHKLSLSTKELNSDIKAQLGLGHNYSRARVKFNVNKIDNMIIQSIHLVDQLDKDINTFAMRVREWYSYHFPELIKVVPENHLFVKCVSAIRDRKNMSEDIEEKLENILMDSTKVKDIIELARSSMGMEISPMDMENVTVFAERISSLMCRRKELMDYLKSKMHSVAPNLATLIGETVGARLIAHAGSLINLAKFPASTVQILGAEKALFRALKTRGNTPKYGLIYHSTFIGRAGKTNKGRISRYLANKCSVASRIDCFRDIPTEVFGSKLRQQVEDRLKFYETGEIPAKNIDVMAVALDEADVVAATVAKQKRKAEKKEKKRLSQQLDNITQNSINSFTLDEENEDANDQSMVSSEKKKKKKKHNITQDSVNSSAFEEENVDGNDQSMVNSEKKKKKKRKSESMENAELNEDSPAKKVKIENGDEINNTNDVVDDDAVAAAIAKQKRKAEKKEKKRLSQQLNNSIAQNSFSSFAEENGEADEQSVVNSEKKKKKKHKKHSMENSGLSETSLGGMEIQYENELNSSTQNDSLADVSVEKHKKKKKKKCQDE